MSIITKPTISKGVTAIFTLSKSELAAHPKVIADSYFSIQDNWNKVSVVFGADKQKETVVFDMNDTIPQGEFLVSVKAKSPFIFKYMQISDRDGGRLVIEPADLSSEELAELEIVLE